jgi:hypothetical protein
MLEIFGVGPLHGGTVWPGSRPLEPQDLTFNSFYFVSPTYIFGNKESQITYRSKLILAANAVPV